MDGGSRPGWRKRDRASGGRRAARGESTSAWRERRRDDAQRAVFYHRLRLTSLGLLAVVLTGCFVYWLLWSGKQTPLILLTVTHYAGALPPNGYAAEDREWLTGSHGPAEIKPLPDDRRGKLSRNDCLTLLDQTLQRARAGGPQREVVLIYLSAHGMVDGQDRPCLLFSDADPLDSTTWLPVSQLLERLQTAQAVPQAARRKLVMFLDASRLDEAWELGRLANTFAEALAQAVTEARVPRLYVLNSTAAGQRGWTAPELGGTAFGVHLARGLSGAAAGDDNQITLRELDDYLRREVARWTINHRDAVQAPWLIPALAPDEDFAVAFAAKRPLEATAPEALAARRQDLQQRLKDAHELWVQAGRLRGVRHLVRAEPLGAATLDQQLLRLEQLAWAGTAYHAEFAAAQGEIRRLLDELGRPDLPPGLPAFSLPLAFQLESVPETAAERERLWKTWQAAGSRPRPKEGDAKPSPPPSYLTAADVVANWLARQNQAGREQLADLLQFVDSTGGRRPPAATGRDTRGTSLLPDVVEVQFLRMLERCLDWSGAGADQPLAAHLPRAVQARQLAEQAAAPADERAYYWVQPLIDAADQQRRQAEDQLFLGDPAALAKADKAWEALLAAESPTGYPAALRRAEEVSRALALRDEVWAELPMLAAWRVRQLRDAPAREADLPDRGADSTGGPTSAVRPATGADVLDGVAQLVRGNEELGTALDQALVEGAAQLPAEAVRNVATRWSELKQQYLTQARDLAQAAGRDKPTLRRIGEALHVPLLAADERRQLTEKYVDILFREGGLTPAVSPTGAERGPEDAAVKRASEALRRELQALGRPEPHPALRLLDPTRQPLPDEPRGADAGHAAVERTWLARQGEEIRQHLRDLRVSLSQKRPPADADAAPAQARLTLSQADRRVRAAATLLATAGWRRTESEPAGQLHRLDRHFQILWHARRLLDDCWGPVPTRAAGAYFAQTAARYLEAAKLLGETTNAIRYSREDLRERLTRRAQAVAAIRLQPTPVTTLGEEPAVDQQVDIQWPADLPVGTAAVYLQPADAPEEPGPLVPVQTVQQSGTLRRQACAVPAEPQPAVLKHQIPLDVLAPLSGEAMFATVLYRGHLIRQPFPVRRPERVTLVEVVPQPAPNARVTVRGDGQRRGHILFVFDCSGSMSRRSRSLTEAGIEQPRIEHARQALRHVLDQLVQKGRWEVGLRAYGHRAKFNADGTPAADNQGIDPDLDVELLVPAQPLDATHVRRLKDRLDELQPRGQTPLYYALLTVLQGDDFRHAKPEEPVYVIVITDGVNQQVHRQTAPDEVEAARRRLAKQRDVQIHVIGFQMEPKPEELPELEKLKTLLRQAGGTYYDAADTTALTQALLEALRQVEYSVAKRGTEPRVTERKELGQPWEVAPVDPLAAYVVQLHGIERPPATEVRLEGGEALELMFEKAGRQLVFPYYDPRSYDPQDDKRGEEEVADPVTGDTYSVRALLPQRKNKDVLFFVAVQHKDAERERPWTRRFTARPKHVWAEIRPVVEGSALVYRFTDPDFVLARPVPVLQFLARDWPREASRAEIRLWFQEDAGRVQPDERQAVPPGATAKLETAALPGTAFEIRTQSLAGNAYRVVVTQRDPSDERFGTARVQVQAAQPLARVAHRFFAGVHVVRHEFDFPQQTAATVEVTARDKLIAAAVAPPPLRVRIED